MKSDWIEIWSDSSYKQKKQLTKNQLIALLLRGSERIRTAVAGFADLCLSPSATEPIPYSGLQRYKIRTNSEALKILFQNDTYFFNIAPNRRIHFR